MVKLNDRERAMNRQVLRIGIEQEDMAKQCTKYATEGNQNELRRVARQLITLEKKMNYYQTQNNKLSKIKESMESVINDQVCNNAILDVMEATTIDSIDPAYAKTIAVQFTNNKMVSSVVREILEDELDADSDEEEFTIDDEKRVQDLIKSSQDEAKQKLMGQLPAIDGCNLTSILTMTDDELKKQHTKDQQQMNQFLSQKQHS